jgi:hypothetical protein
MDEGKKWFKLAMNIDEQTVRESDIDDPEPNRSGPVRWAAAGRVRVACFVFSEA